MGAQDNPNDIPAPAGYVFVTTSDRRLAHLSPSDETDVMPLCGASAESTREHAFLPHGFETCPSCLRIADEASTRPI